MEIIFTEVFLFILLILLTGFLTASEIAISSFGENKIEELKEKKDKHAEALQEIHSNQESFFGSIQLLLSLSLVVVSIIGFNIAYQLLFPFFQQVQSQFIHTYHFIISFFSSILVVFSVYIIFGHLIPRTIGFRYSSSIGKIAIGLLLPLSRLLKFPVKIFTSISNIFLIPLKEKTSFWHNRPSEDEILDLISEGVKSGSINQKEEEIIRNIFEFNDLKANEVMIPRTEMIAVDINDETETTLETIIKTGHSLIPVYSESPDNIIGVLHTKDLMKEFMNEDKITLPKMMRPAYFIPENKLISEVLTEMQQLGERLAIVTDEYGGTSGLITMEDILEEIVGEIKDKTKREINDYYKVTDGIYYIIGSMDIDDFNDTFTFEIPSSNSYSTIAGFVADISGKILEPGEISEFSGINFLLIKKIRQKMVQFKVYSNTEKLIEKSKASEPQGGED